MAAEAQRASSVRERKSFAASSGVSTSPQPTASLHARPAVQPVPADLAGRIENLAATAEYLECLIDAVKDAAGDLQGYVASGVCSHQMREWRQIGALLNLALTQVDIVESVAREFGKARVAVSI